MKKNKNKTPEDLKTIIYGLVDAAGDTAAAILNDNVFSEDAETEIETVFTNLYSAIDKLEIPDLENFIDLLEVVKQHPGFDPGELLELIELDEDDIADKAVEFGYIKLDKDTSIFDRQKIIDFINENIYPHNTSSRYNIA